MGIKPRIPNYPPKLCKKCHTYYTQRGNSICEVCKGTVNADKSDVVMTNDILPSPCEHGGFR